MVRWLLTTAREPLPCDELYFYRDISYKAVSKSVKRVRNLEKHYRYYPQQNRSQGGGLHFNETEHEWIALHMKAESDTKTTEEHSCQDGGGTNQPRIESESPRMSVIEKSIFTQRAHIAHLRARVTWCRHALQTSNLFRGMVNMTETSPHLASASRAIVAPYLEPLVDTVLVEGVLARHQTKVVF